VQTNSNNGVIRIQNLAFAYDGNPVLESVDLTIKKGEFAWIVGPNGGGKTTLLKLILGLLKPSSGSVEVLGGRPERTRSRIGYMPQRTDLDRLFPASVLDIVLMGLVTNGYKPGGVNAQDRQAAEEALDEVSLLPQREARFSTLSGGQFQRLLLARALVSQPELLLLDEPTANLDPIVERELHELLKSLSDHQTIVMVSHDLSIVSDFVREVICVNRQVAVHQTRQVDENLMGDIYGRPLRVVRHDSHHGSESHDV
jgi:zinc transport system ATP-binding protein